MDEEIIDDIDYRFDGLEDDFEDFYDFEYDDGSPEYTIEPGSVSMTMDTNNIGMNKLIYKDELNGELSEEAKALRPVAGLVMWEYVKFENLSEKEHIPSHQWSSWESTRASIDSTVSKVIETGEFDAVVREMEQVTDRIGLAQRKSVPDYSDDISFGDIEEDDDDVLMSIVEDTTDIPDISDFKFPDGKPKSYEDKPGLRFVVFRLAASVCQRIDNPEVFEDFAKSIDSDNEFNLQVSNIIKMSGADIDNDLNIDDVDIDIDGEEEDEEDTDPLIGGLAETRIVEVEKSRGNIVDHVRTHKFFAGLSLVSLALMGAFALAGIGHLSMFFGFIMVTTGCFVLFSPAEASEKSVEKGSSKGYAEVAQEIIDDIDMRYLHAATDPYTVLTMPSILNVSSPETADYLSAVDQAKAVVDNGTAESVEAASKARRAWHNAVNIARKKGVPGVSQKDQDKAHKLVDRILHSGTSEEERKNALDKFEKIISVFAEPEVHDKAMKAVSERTKELTGNRAIEM